MTLPNFNMVIIVVAAVTVGVVLVLDVYFVVDAVDVD